MSKKMDNYELVEHVLLLVSDAMTTSRLGLSEGRIELKDLADVLDKVLETLARVSGAVQSEEFTREHFDNITEAASHIVMG
jgi:hypothetical protein